MTAATAATMCHRLTPLALPRMRAMSTPMQVPTLMQRRAARRLRLRLVRTRPRLETPPRTGRARRTRATTASRLRRAATPRRRGSGCRPQRLRWGFASLVHAIPAGAFERWIAPAPTMKLSFVRCHVRAATAVFGAVAAAQLGQDGTSASEMLPCAVQPGVEPGLAGDDILPTEALHVVHLPGERVGAQGQAGLLAALPPTTAARPACRPRACRTSPPCPGCTLDASCLTHI